MKSISRWAVGVLSGTLLATVGAAGAQADADDAGSAQAYSIGPASAREAGEAGALLFPVFASALDDYQEGAEPDFFAYCIEMGVRARFHVDIELGEWNEFPGENRFTENAEVQNKVGWIINNSYPTVPLAELRGNTGIEGLTAPQAIAGTQFAIWHLTDGENRRLSNNASALRDYLTGEDNIGLPENDVRPQVQIYASESANHELGAPIGPLVVEANIEPISVATDVEFPFVDATGGPIDTAELPSGSEIYLDVPNESEPGSATIEARINAARVNGSILKVPSASKEQTHAQTLILVKNATATSVESAEIYWTTPKLPTLVEPITPRVEQEVCDAPGQDTYAHLIEVPTDGVSYEYSREEIYPGSVVSVVARAHEGFELAGVEGWEIAENGTAITEVHIPAPECPAEEEPSAPREQPTPEEPAEPESPTEPVELEEPPLPDTGAPSMGLIALAAVLMTGGMAVLLVLRRV